MAKRKKDLPKDDLIDQLLDDVGDIAADSSLQDEEIDVNERASAVKPVVGLGADAVEISRLRKDNPWDSIESDLGDASSNHGFFGGPGGEEPSLFKGPSADGGYQSVDDLNAPMAPSFESAQGHENEATRQISAAQGSDDRTAATGASGGGTSTLGAGDNEATIAAEGFGQRKSSPKASPQEKVVIGSLRGARSGNVQTSVDASLAQAENLKIAQQRILDLEKENDRLRQENEEVSSAADIIRGRLEEMGSRTSALEKEKSELQEAAQNEIMILKGNLQYKESEVAKARLKIDELETRLRNDFKKIRVKERELENRLELARAEKAALVRAKDENILELKRKIDQSQSEIDNYREKLLELNKTIDANQEQFKRTVRALRLALTNLEAKDENVVPLKKAE